MPENTKLVTARRSYEFRPDELQLSFVVAPFVQEQIRQAFSFQFAQVGQPVPTFGPVPATLPQGLVFNFGAVPFPANTLTPIRFLHVEARRIVVDVRGASTAIDAVFEQVESLLARIPTSDGLPILGHVERTLDYSEISTRLSFPPDMLWPGSLHPLIRRTLDRQGNGTSLLVPALHVRLQGPEEEYSGTSQGFLSEAALRLELRTGTRPGDHTYYSAAPLDTDTHLAFLTQFEAAVATWLAR